jgi:hypothetical protein
MSGIKRVDNQRTIAEVNPSFFDSVTGDEVINPRLKDFMLAADDEAKFDSLEAAEISAEEREQVKDVHDNPLLETDI